MRKFIGSLFTLSILFLAACSQTPATSRVSDPTQAPTPTLEESAEPAEAATAEPTQAPTDAPEPTDIPPTPTEEPTEQTGPFISSGVNLDDLADRMTLFDMLYPDQASLAAFTGEDILQFAVDATGGFITVAMIDEDLGPFTVFAPTFKFEDIPSFNFPTTAEYGDALAGHIVLGLYLQSDLLNMDGQTLQTLRENIQIHVSVKDGVVYLNDSAMIIDADILGSNGVIQVIDQFLIPAAQ